MRKLMIKVSMSLDGFIAKPDGDNRFIFPSMDDQSNAWEMETIKHAGLHLMGSRTFRDMASYWPSSSEEYAPPMNDIPKAVFSKDTSITKGPFKAVSPGTDDQAAKRKEKPLSPATVKKNEESWHDARVFTGDLASGIKELKSESGGDIIAYGGARFLQSLIATKLVDEFEFLIAPVIIGKGLPIFTKVEQPFELTLIKATAFPKGAVAHSYRPAE